MSDRSTSLPDWVPGVKLEASRQREAGDQTSPTSAEESGGKAKPGMPLFGVLRPAVWRYPSLERHGPSFPTGMFTIVDHRYIARPAIRNCHSLGTILSAK